MDTQQCSSTTPSTFGVVATTQREPATCSMLSMSVSSSFSLFLVTAVVDQTSLAPHTAPQLVFLSLGDSLEEIVSLSLSAVLEVEYGGHCVCMLKSL